MDTYFHDELKLMAQARKEKEEAQSREDKHFTNIVIHIEEKERENEKHT